MGVIPVILGGGYGLRLWPLSRNNRPKQFLELPGLSSGRTLFDQALLRCRHKIFDRRPIVVGAERHRFLIGEALSNFAIQADVVLEPSAKNTCAAITAACFQALHRSVDALVFIMAADHDIEDRAAFAKAVEAAIPAALNGRIVTFGVEARRGDTNYGYIAPGEAEDAWHCVNGFHEKPQAELAETFFRNGYLWNSGNFLFRADVALEQIGRYQPRILSSVKTAFTHREVNRDFVRLGERGYCECPPLSFDHGILEKTDLAVTIPVSYNWRDLGNWDGFAALGDSDEAGNSIIGDLISHESRNNFVHSEGRFTALLGVENLIVIATADAILVADRTRGEEVRVLVDKLAQQDQRALESRKYVKPWGWFERLDVGEAFQVKRLHVQPGAELSLQKHAKRAEHWVVVKGIAKVSVGGKTRICGPDTSIFIPREAVHRLSNPGSDMLVVVEVQTGDYFGEDDLERLEDRYDRIPPQNRIKLDAG